MTELMEEAVVNLEFMISPFGDINPVDSLRDGGYYGTLPTDTVTALADDREHECAIFGVRWTSMYLALLRLISLVNLSLTAPETDQSPWSFWMIYLTLSRSQSRSFHSPL